MRFLSARSDADDVPYATLFDATGTVLADLKLAARGHGAARHPLRDEAVLFGRRPGTHFTVIDLDAGHKPIVIGAGPNRHFNGHGLFSPDGSRLYATETVSDSGDGMVGIYDADNSYARTGEFPSGGLDPHDIRWRPDGTIVVANGGLLVDPAAPGIKLNIDSMESSLAILDPRDGTWRQSVRLAPTLHQLSLRHLAVGADGTVAVAMQYEGPDLDEVPLVGSLPLQGDTIAMLDLPPTSLKRLDHYCGSAAVDAAGRLLAITSPRGGHAVFWDLAQRRFLGWLDVADGSGVAAAGDGGFMLSSGLGALLHARPEIDVGGPVTVTPLLDAEPLAPSTRWDNHILALDV